MFNGIGVGIAVITVELFVAEKFVFEVVSSSDFAFATLISGDGITLSETASVHHIIVNRTGEIFITIFSFAFTTNTENSSIHFQILLAIRTITKYNQKIR